VRCHADHAIAKFWGVCNEQKWALDACLREEKAINRCALVCSVSTVFHTMCLLRQKRKSHSCAQAPLLASLSAAQLVVSCGAQRKKLCKGQARAGEPARQARGGAGAGGGRARRAGGALSLAACRSGRPPVLAGAGLPQLSPPMAEVHPASAALADAGELLVTGWRSSSCLCLD
jgi:hypothetical protein